MSDIIVIGARGIPNVEGGAEKNAEKLFPLFAEAGYGVEFVGLQQFIKSPSYKGVKLTGVPTTSFFKTDKVVYNMVALLMAAVKRPRIVHLQCLNAALFLLLYKLVGLKVVVRYGSSDHEFTKWRGLGRYALKLCEYQVRYADHVITVSQRFRRQLKERYGIEKITVIPNGLDPVQVSPQSEAFLNDLGLNGKRFVLSVGRVTADKDFETLVEAVRQLRDPDVQLIVAGGGEAGYAEKFFDHKDPRVRFIGRVERDLLAALYANCAVYVNSSRHEGLSNAILEALSYSCPIVVSDIAANTELALPEHNYFETGNAKALSRQLEKALEEPDAFVAPADGFAQWSDVFEATLKVYQTVAPGRFGRSVRAEELRRAA
jgi:glycosyltransferase involved in cell wall biosynthesis